jgi:hypothetical protein
MSCLVPCNEIIPLQWERETSAGSLK